MRRAILAVIAATVLGIVLWWGIEGITNPTPQGNPKLTASGFAPNSLDVRLGIPGGATGLIRITNQSDHTVTLCIVANGACQSNPSWTGTSGAKLGAFVTIAGGTSLDIRFVDEGTFVIAPRDNLNHTLTIKAADVGHPEGD